MNCLESQEILQHRLDGVPTARDTALDQHLAQCPLCRARHAAASLLLDGLKAMPHRLPSAGLTTRIAAAVLRDRERRRARVRRSLYVTAALPASILLMLLFAYFSRPTGADGKIEPGPLARDIAPRKPEPEPPPSPAPPTVQKKAKQEQPHTFAALTGRLADKTVDQAKVLWTAANPIEGIPVGEVPKVKELEPAAEPLRQARQEVNESLQAVGHSARRAFDYFARELPMLDMPPTPDPQ